MTPEQKRLEAERAEFESDTLLWEVPDADSVSEGLMIWLSWKARARIAHQREAELAAEIARLRDELQLKCSPAEIATQVPEEWRAAVQEFVDRCERGEIRSRRTYSLFKELLTAAPKRQAVAVPDEWRDKVVECARRLVEHADFKLGGILSADSKAKDIPSQASSTVKARHLASLRSALAAPQPTTEESSPVDPLSELTAMSQELGVGYGPDNGHLPPEALRVVRFIFRHFGPPHMAAELPDELVPDIRALEAMFKAQGVIV